VLIYVVIPIFVHVAPYWLWTSHVRYERLATATAAIEQAQMYQARLRINRKCVSHLPGWNVDPEEGSGALATEVKPSGKRLTIECDQKNRKFWISISFPRDNFGYIEGQFNGPLKAVYWRGAKLESSAISEGVDADALARLLALGE
jgi:hypothetical protein